MKLTSGVVALCALGAVSASAVNELETANSGCPTLAELSKDTLADLVPAFEHCEMGIAPYVVSLMEQVPIPLKPVESLITKTCSIKVVAPVCNMPLNGISGVIEDLIEIFQGGDLQALIDDLKTLQDDIGKLFPKGVHAAAALRSRKPKANTCPTLKQLTLDLGHLDVLIPAFEHCGMGLAPYMVSIITAVPLVPAKPIEALVAKTCSVKAFAPVCNMPINAITGLIEDLIRMKIVPKLVELLLEIKKLISDVEHLFV